MTPGTHQPGAIPACSARGRQRLTMAERIAELEGRQEEAESRAGQQDVLQ